MIRGFYFEKPLLSQIAQGISRADPRYKGLTSEIRRDNNTIEQCTNCTWTSSAGYQTTHTSIYTLIPGQILA